MTGSLAACHQFEIIGSENTKQDLGAYRIAPNRTRDGLPQSMGFGLRSHLPEPVQIRRSGGSLSGLFLLFCGQRPVIESMSGRLDSRASLSELPLAYQRFHLLELPWGQYGIDLRTGSQSRVDQDVEYCHVITCRSANGVPVVRRVQVEPIQRSLGFTKSFAEFFDFLLVTLVNSLYLADLFVGERKFIDMPEHRVSIAFVRSDGSFLQTF